MSGEGVMLDVAAAVADGTQVDWDDLERRANTDHERRIVQSLRMVAAVGELHSTGEALGTAGHLLDTAPDLAVTQGTGGIERWGRYEIRAKLGQGAQGSVYKAWDPQLECEVALKILQPGLSADRMGERVLREGRALARVRHPNVVNVYGVETHAGQSALCMEFIRGRTLEDFVRAQGPLGPQEAVTMGVAVGRALAAVHAAGLVHRDVKTRNVMREEKGRIVLMDFGTGRDHAQLARAGAGDLAGTPIYMAPEVLLGSAASQQSDIYSVGVLLYTLVSGRYPVEGRTIDEIVVAHQRGVRSPLAQRRPDLPDSFIRIVDRATAADPAQRYETAGALVHDLVALDVTDVPRLAPSKVAERLLAAGTWIGISMIAVTLLGFITSMLFNAMLERTTVATESMVDWFVWGLRSLIGPVFSMAQVLILAFAAVTVWRLLRRFFKPMDRWAEGVDDSARSLVRRLSLDQPDTFAQVILVGGLAYLAVVCASNWPLVTALTTPLSGLHMEQRALLSPASGELHYAYRSALDWLVLGTGLSLYRLKRFSRRGPVAGLMPYMTVGAVFALAVLLWGGPYRVLFQSERPKLTVSGERCYQLGENAQGTLVYCPGLTQSRVRRVTSGDVTVQDTGITESIFTAP